MTEPITSKIEVHDIYAAFVREQFVPQFAKSGIGITQNAQNLIAYTMQSQIEEKLLQSDEELIARCERFSDFAVQMYNKHFGHSEMNFNRAMHLIVALTCA